MSKVNNDEVLWRSVFPDEVHSSPAEPLHLKSTAFNDRSKKISVDRAVIRVDPNLTKRDATCGIVSLDAKQVRDIGVFKRKINDGTAIEHFVDVIPDVIEPPEPPNPSHALIVTKPHNNHDGTFKKLKEALVRIASPRGWVLSPSAELGATNGAAPKVDGE